MDCVSSSTVPVAALSELAAVLESVHPGKRIRTGTLLRGPIVHPAVEMVLRDPSLLISLVESVPVLSAVACFGILKTEDSPVVLRRRFSRWERTRAIVDLNNVIWTLEADRLVTVISELRRYGVNRIVGVGDANFPHLISAGQYSAVRARLDALHIAPHGTPADPIILTHAELENAMIVSNDMFRAWRRSSPWRRRNIYRLRVPVVRAPGTDSGFSFAEPGLELQSPPLVGSA